MTDPARPEPGPPPIVVADLIGAPLAVGGLSGAAGLFGLAVGQPRLFPNLGPTASVQAESPEQPSTMFRATVIGHAIGRAAAVAAGSLNVAALGGGVRRVRLRRPVAPARAEVAVTAAANT